MPERRRLARDPLADLLDRPPPERPPSPAEASRDPARPHRRDDVPHASPSKMDPDLADQVRDAVMWLHKVDVHTTMSAIAETGLRAELQRLAAAHHDGRPFPKRTGDVPTGRPPGRQARPTPERQTRLCP